jgi:hypothetical protein
MLIEFFQLNASEASSLFLEEVVLLARLPFNDVQDMFPLLMPLPSASLRTLY